MDKRNYYEERVGKIRKKTNAAVILKPENVYYFSGFYAKDSTLLILNNEVFLLVSFLYFEEAKKVLSGKNIKILIIKKDRFQELENILKDYKIKKIAMEFSYISYKDFLTISKNLKKQDIKICDISRDINELRLIKDEYELQKISKAASIVDNIYEDLTRNEINYFKSKSEALLSLEVEKKIIEKGGEKKSFDFVVAYNKNSSKPHYSPDDVKIDQGIVLMDFGAKYKNYCSDITRTFILKNYNEFDKIYDIVLKAQMMAIEKVKEGVCAKELDAVARDYIKSKGYGEFFGHGLGHGVGLEIHEEPYLSQRTDCILKEDMVITIEPGIYLKGTGGVRIEDMLIVKKNSSINLYQSNKKKIYII